MSSTLVAFATWLVDMACEAGGVYTWLTPLSQQTPPVFCDAAGAQGVSDAVVAEFEFTSRLPLPTASLVDQLGVPA